ncbi:MAG TPA: L-histidine N(alpha)-methyltransferase [Rhodocyclaceae bacterium]
MRNPQPIPQALSEFGRDMLDCLAYHPHRIAPKYFYDAAGSQLFDRICELPEYYLTRTELALYAAHGAEMAALIGPAAEVIEFGAGSLKKVRLLLQALQAPRRFVAVDISGAHLQSAAAELRRDYPELAVDILVADFSDIAALPLGAGDGRRIGFFPGSTIGNFSPPQARRFLSAAARLLAGGGLLIGVDLIKAPHLLNQAYNDAAGVTAAFNRNLLARANRELGCDFDLAGFRHHAFYNPGRQRIEMHLMCAAPQQVSLYGQGFRLHEGDSIHTEDSYKYSIEGFQALAADCGFAPEAVWCDPQQLFSVHWLAAP